MRLANFLLIVISLTALSCERVKRKGHQLAGKAKEKVAAKAAVAIDMAVPTFDSDKADTRFNKKRFKDFFGFTPTPDVSGIYCYNDPIGIDTKFIFSFKCDTTTVAKIVQSLGLTQADKPNNSSEGLWEKFPWWDSAKIKTLIPYYMKGEREYYRYMWYDRDLQKAYYIAFDL